MNLHLGIDFDYIQQRYRSCNHQHGHYRENVINDPFSDVVKVVAEALSKKAQDAGIEPAALALSFTQSLPYAYNQGPYQEYAAECMISGGDCSDKAVLFLSLLYFMHIDCVFLSYPTHLMTAVWCIDNRKGTYFLQKGKRYYMCEQTGGNDHIGDCWGEYCNAQADIIELY